MKFTFLIFILLMFQASILKTVIADDDFIRRQKIEKMFLDYQTHFKTAPTVSAEDLVSLQRNPRVLIVDVRADNERKISVIPGLRAVDWTGLGAK